MFEPNKRRLTVVEALVLIPLVLLLGLFAASLLGYNPLGADRLQMLKAATSWGLVGLIVIGGVRGWKSIRVIIIAYIAWKFSSLIYDWFSHNLSVRHLVLRLLTAVVLSCVAVWFFWPRESRR